MKKIIEGKLVLKDSLEYGQLIYSGDTINEIILDKTKFVKADETIPNDCFVCPGFIELQINGGFGKEFKTDTDAIQVVSDNLYKFGTTSFCPTVTTRHINTYEKHLNALLQNFTYNGGTKFLGFHLEGPCLNPKKVGAQNADWVVNPKDLNLEKYLNQYVKIVSLAPELEGGKELVKELIKKGIKVGVAHSLISFEDLKAIYDHQNMWLIHLFNAMEPLKSRDPGIVGFGLTENALCGLIVDKIHLHPKTVELTCKLKLNDIISVSDGSAVTGLEAGTYHIGERTMIKTEERVTLPNGTLVGSILTQNGAIKNIIEITGCQINEAVKTVSYNPAKLLGVENQIGQLQVGNKADIVILSDKYQVKRAIINGNDK